MNHRRNSTDRLKIDVMMPVLTRMYSDDDLDRAREVRAAKREFDARADISIFITAEDLLRARKVPNLILRLRLSDDAGPMTIPAPIADPADTGPIDSPLPSPHSRGRQKYSSNDSDKRPSPRGTSREILASVLAEAATYSIFVVEADLSCRGMTDGQIETFQLKQMETTRYEIMDGSSAITINVYALPTPRLEYPTFMHIVTFDYECSVAKFKSALLPQVLARVNGGRT